MKIIQKLMRRIRRPGELFRYGGIRKRSLYIFASKILRRSIISPRICVYDTKYAKQTSCHTIDHAKGYLRIEALDNSVLIRDVLHQAQYDLSNHFECGKIRHHKDYLQAVDSIKRLDFDHPYLKLALSDELVALATRYLGFTPILSDLLLWYSPNDNDELQGSQFFHLDYADVSQVKVFVLITDVDENSGPTAVINAISSREICETIDYKLSNKDIRISDDIIFSHIKTSDVVTATGKAGSVFIADTSRCLHYGSRHAKKPRAVLLIQYVSPFSFRYSLDFRKEAKFAHLISPRNSDEINLLLGND